VTDQFDWITLRLFEDIDVLGAAESRDDAENREGETEVADTIRDECFT
jgi:hypothetical protein